MGILANLSKKLKGKLKALDLHKDKKLSTVPLDVTLERRTERSVFP